MNFKEWLTTEWANYGINISKIEKPVYHSNDEKPINPINAEIIMAELNRLPLGVHYPRWEWQDMIEWGSEVGALKLDISPLGSYKTITRRKIKDLKGEVTWICKTIHALDENEHNTNEIALAHQIYEELKVCNEESLEGPARTYPEFERLCWALSNAGRQDYPSYCMFPYGTKKVDENYFKIIYEFKGHGVESPTRGRAEQFNIDLFWDKRKGLIRCWGYNIDSDIRRHTWEIMPSEFDEWFSPAQPIEQIVECVIKIFKTY